MHTHSTGKILGFLKTKNSCIEAGLVADIFVGKCECGEPVAGWRSRWLDQHDGLSMCEIVLVLELNM